MNKINSFFILLSFIFISNASAQRIDFLNENQDIIYDLDIFNNKLLVALSRNKVNYWNLDTKEIIRSYTSDNRKLTCLDLSTDGKSTVIGDASGSIKVLKSDTDALELTQSILGQGAITDVEFNKTNSQVVASFQSGLIVVWDINSGETWKMQNHGKGIMTVDFSDDENYLATGDVNGLVKIWAIKELKEIASYKAHKSWVKDLLWCESDSMILSVGYDGKIVICTNFIGSTNNLILRKIGNAGKISSVAYVPETKSIVTCNLSGIVRIYFQYGTYTYKSSYAMHALKTIPSKDNYSNIVVGTNGKGVIIIDSRDMKLKNY